MKLQVVSRALQRERWCWPLAMALMAGAYLLMDMNWRDTALALIIYSCGRFLLRQFAPQALHGALQRVWLTAFVLDLGVKSFLISVYQTKPDAVLIIDSLSNTNSGETFEFIEQYWRLIGLFLGETLLVGVLLWRLLPAVQARSRVSRIGGLVVLALVLGLQFNPTFRRNNPFYFWPSQVGSYTAFQKNIKTLGQKREVARREMQTQWQPVYQGPAQDTVVVALGESTSRWDWQLYGYPRQTNPQLAKLGDELLVFRDVLSGAGGTVSSFKLMLTPRDLHNQLDDESSPSVMLLAKAAGYKTFWISNQHDRYINPRFAEEADEMHLVNTGGGRGDRKLDEGVLPYYEQALRDPAPRKLIVVHLLGAHPDYALRSPDDFKRFDGDQDAVGQALKARGRNAWVRYERDVYDDAMLYQDHILARLLDTLKASSGGSSASFLYTSDHAQEVGHTRDFAGHSGEEPGQVVPLLIWLSSPLPAPQAQALEQRPYQTDRLDWTLLDLLHIKTRRDLPGASLLSADYHALPRYLVNHPRQPYQPSTRAPVP
ncbi:heptose-I-phosphate ethanolaminephosphotransferase [Solimonas aquatica]|uniref:Heptose-I-phosphate ethanolaminephosphotransferase n=1 Tax=Solimonas aquatica TaxID=489703 RepID=A0A1H9AMB4_9GAMM|nr:phosphoethanolamine transferase [Solimonas aquatica]SEP77904.1 heptose-I-phosphate ethanolaminephosphotransferase [Solimonas aquatica]